MNKTLVRMKINFKIILTQKLNYILYLESAFKFFSFLFYKCM